MITLHCVICGQELQELPVTAAQINTWRESRVLIQDAFPQLDAYQRELILTGIGPKCWNKLFGEEE